MCVFGDALQDVFSGVKHGINNALRDDPISVPVPLKQVLVLAQRLEQFLLSFFRQRRVVLWRPVRPARVLYFKHLGNNWMIRGWRVQICDMPALFRRHRSPEGFLNGIHVQQVNLTEEHAAETHSGERLMAVCFPTAFVVDSFISLRSSQQHVVSVVIVMHGPEAGKDSHQSKTITVHNQFESLFLIVGQDQVILVWGVPVVEGSPCDSRRRLT